MDFERMERIEKREKRRKQFKGLWDPRAWQPSEADLRKRGKRGASMARMRGIKPEFWSDSKTGTLSDGATKLFIGIWNFADDRGVMRDDIYEMRAKIYPYAKESPESLIVPRLEELFAKRLLMRLKYDGEGYVWVKNFSKHQNVEKPSWKSLIIPMGENLLKLTDTSVDKSVTVGNHKAKALFGEESGSGRGGVGEESGSGRGGVGEESVQLDSWNDGVSIEEATMNEVIVGEESGSGRGGVGEDSPKKRKEVKRREEKEKQESLKSLSTNIYIGAVDKSVENSSLSPKNPSGNGLQEAPPVDKSNEGPEMAYSPIYEVWHKFAERCHPGLKKSKGISQGWIESCKVVVDKGGTLEEVEKILRFVEKDKPKNDWEGWSKVITSPDKLAKHYYTILEQLIVQEEKSLGLPREVKVKSRDAGSAQEAACRICKKRIILTPLKGWIHMPSLGDEPHHPAKPLGISDLKPLDIPESIRGVVMRLQIHHKRKQEKKGGGNGPAPDGEPEDSGKADSEKELKTDREEETAIG